MISATDLRDEVIIPVLQDLERIKPGMYNLRAVYLLLGTAAQESDMGYFMRQHPTGPARGVWQMEPATAQDLWNRYLDKPENGDLRLAVVKYWTGKEPVWEEITWNLKLACALARIRYWMVPVALPYDREGQARYWDIHYNANEEDEVAEYLASWDKFVRL